MLRYDPVGYAPAGNMRCLGTCFACSYVAIVLSLSGCQRRTGEALEELSDRRYPVDSASPTISVTNRDGAISVYAGSEDVREVRVETLKKAYTAERLKTISTRVTPDKNSISIETIYPTPSGGTFSDRSGTVDYVITVPQNATIAKLDLTNGEVLIEGVRSKESHAQLGSGRLFVHNCFGSVDAHVKTGNLALVYEWWEEQSDFVIRAGVEDGNAFAYLPKDATFHLVANTGTGKIANDFGPKEQRRAEMTNHLDLRIGGAERPRIEMEAQDGNVRIAEHNP